MSKKQKVKVLDSFLSRWRKQRENTTSMVEEAELVDVINLVESAKKVVGGVAMSKEEEKVVRCPMCGKGEIGDEYDYDAEEFIYFCWDCGNQWTEERV